MGQENRVRVQRALEADATFLSAYLTGKKHGHHNEFLKRLAARHHCLSPALLHVLSCLFSRDREFVLAAVGQDSAAIAFASVSLQTDREVISKAAFNEAKKTHVSKFDKLDLDSRTLGSIFWGTS